MIIKGEVHIDGEQITGFSLINYNVEEKRIEVIFPNEIICCEWKTPPKENGYHQFFFTSDSITIKKINA